MRKSPDLSSTFNMLLIVYRLPVCSKIRMKILIMLDVQGRKFLTSNNKIPQIIKNEK